MPMKLNVKVTRVITIVLTAIHDTVWNKARLVDLSREEYV
jgi:hypothetical protein